MDPITNENEMPNTANTFFMISFFLEWKELAALLSEVPPGSNHQQDDCRFNYVHLVHMKK
jgi:hypothetical protein